MKKILVFLLSFMLISGAFAAEKATPQEVVDKCKEVLAYYKKHGKAETIKAVQSDKNFIWKDTYVFLTDMTGTNLAHPVKKVLVGRNLIGISDVNGFAFMADFIRIAKTPPHEGWSQYMWPKPGEKDPSVKSSYVLKVPDSDFFISAGVYDTTKKEAEAAINNK